MSQTRSQSLLGLALAAALAGCTNLPPVHDPLDEQEGTAGSVGDAVAMRNNRFEPSLMRTVVGATVEWTNKDGVAHTVTPVNRTAWRMENGSDPDGIWLERGQRWSHTFDEPGTYHYYCVPHSWEGDEGQRRGMTGRVEVTPSDAA